MIRVAVTGAAGKMGRMLVQTISETAGMQLTAAIERSGSSAIGADAGELVGLGELGVKVSGDLDAVCDEFDVLIDFTIASATIENMEVCARAGCKMVIGTTGLNELERDRLNTLSSEMSVVFATNYSVGVNATFRLLEVAAEIFGDDVDIEIIEAHHKHKVDAPSGTAITMGEVITQTLGRDLGRVSVHGRKGLTGEREAGTIGFHSIRAGDIVGEHTVVFAGAGERVEITHRAHSRTNFAEGAIRAVSWVMNQSPGLYDMRDVLGLKAN